MESNRIIAEFMGVDTHYEAQSSNMFNQYHTSWDRLMPVLKKINLKLNPQNYSRWVRINKPTEYLIGEVHQAVVDFIKNQNN